MCYMERGVGSRTLAALFSLCCVAASLGGGNVVQANSIAASLEAAFGWDRLAVGLVVAVLTGLVILGGIGRIGRVSETLVPCMALLFIGGGVMVLICHRAAIPEALERIVTGARHPQAALGGGLGYGMAAAMRYGVARGVFTNEAGMGSSAIAHAASNVQEPAEQGMWGIFEVFIATLSVCSITALVILTSGVYQENAALLAIQSGTVTSAMVGAPPVRRRLLPPCSAASGWSLWRSASCSLPSPLCWAAATTGSGASSTSPVPTAGAGPTGRLSCWPWWREA